MNQKMLLKLIDSFIGGKLVSLLCRYNVPKKVSTPKFHHLLFIRPGGIGDAVLLIPTLIALHRIFPGIKLTILAEKRNSAVFLLCPAICKVYLYDRLSELITLMKGRYDLVVDTEQWHYLSSVVARLTNSSVLIGFATSERKKVFTNSIEYSLEEYEANSFMRLLQPLIRPVLSEIQTPFLTVAPEFSESIRTHLQPLHGKEIIAIFPSASIQEKRWPNNRYHEVADKLCALGYGIVVVGSKADIHVGNRVVRGLSNTANLCGRLSLPQTAAVLQQTVLLISGDSGILHIGFGLGIKTIALFGPSNTKKWAPRGDKNITITKKLDCSPCSKFGYTPRCKRNNACMELITVDDVFEAAMKLLKEGPYGIDRNQ